MSCAIYSFEKISTEVPTQVPSKNLCEAFKNLSQLLALEFIYEPYYGATYGEKRYNMTLESFVPL